MNMPITFGWPQFLFLVLAIVGIGLIISASMSLFRSRVVTYEDEYGVVRRRRRRRHFKFGRAVGGTMVLLIATSLLWLTFLLQTYIGLTSEIKVAQVKAFKTNNVPHHMSVELILYDGNGKVTSDEHYEVEGDEWMIQANIIKFAPWLNIVGFHSGFKLTRLEGRFDDVNMERNSTHSVVDLNGGDDNFFKTIHTQGGWLAPFVDASYGNAVIIPPDGTYDITMSQDSLIARRVSG